MKPNTQVEVCMIFLSYNIVLQKVMVKLFQIIRVCGQIHRKMYYFFLPGFCNVCGLFWLLKFFNLLCFVILHKH